MLHPPSREHSQSPCGREGTQATPGGVTCCPVVRGPAPRGPAHQVSLPTSPTTTLLQGGSRICQDLCHPKACSAFSPLAQWLLLILHDPAQMLFLQGALANQAPADLVTDDLIQLPAPRGWAWACPFSPVSLPPSSRDNLGWSRVSLNPNVCSPHPCPTVSQPPPLSMGSAYPTLPCGSLFARHPPSLQALPLGLTWEHCSALDLGAPNMPDSGAAHAHALGTLSAAAISLSGSHWTGWMSLNKGHILNCRVLPFQSHSDLGSYCWGKLRSAFSLKVWWGQSGSHRLPADLSTCKPWREDGESGGPSRDSLGQPPGPWLD